MPKPRLGVAAGSRLNTEAAAEIARQGGNAVDACLAAAIMAWVGEPFFASLAGGGFVGIRTPSGDVEIIDGNVVMPQAVPDEPGLGIRRVFLQYSNGMYTGIGGGAVAVSGILKAVRLAWERHGSIEWEALFQPAIRAARAGIAFPQSSAYYLHETWERMWSVWSPSKELFGSDHRPLHENELLVQAELGDSLELIATKGPDVYYSGELASAIVETVAAQDGILSLEDLRSYKAEVREPISTNAFGWHVAANPPPAVGGAVLAHMLALLQPTDWDDDVARLRAIVEAESAAMGYRRENYDEPGLVAGALQEVLKKLPAGMRSPSTTHSSAADADGLICTLTESNGYGSGLVVNGIVLNNTLGEEELNPLGAHRLPPGSRCHSNMCPTIASAPGITYGLGSPGADRITGAIAQTLIALAVDGLPLKEAIEAPRIHLRRGVQGDLLCFEPPLRGQELAEYPPRPYDEIHMFFGGVNAASVRDDGTVDAVHDPRRSGAAALI